MVQHVGIEKVLALDRDRLKLEPCKVSLHLRDTGIGPSLVEHCSLYGGMLHDADTSKTSECSCASGFRQKSAGPLFK